MDYRYPNILAKLAEMRVKDFGPEELQRAFADCVSPQACKRATLAMIEDGLTIEKLKLEEA